MGCGEYSGDIGTSVQNHTPHKGLFGQEVVTKLSWLELQHHQHLSDSGPHCLAAGQQPRWQPQLRGRPCSPHHGLPASGPIHKHRGAETDDTAWPQRIFLPYKTTELGIWLLLPEARGIINPPYLTFLITSLLRYPSLSQPQYF